MRATIYLLLFLSYLAVSSQTPLFYGLTTMNNMVGSGGVFRVDANGNGYVNLHTLDCYEGTFPRGHVTQTASGAIYGIASVCGANGVGAIFRFDTLTGQYQKMTDFSGANGSNPRGSLTFASDGNFYGLSYKGGTGNYGVIFKYDPIGNSLASVHNFDSIQGANPWGNLIQASNGLLYGITEKGGASNSGTLFSYDPVNGSFQILHDFISSTGFLPQGSLLQKTNGLLYGMTYAGGQVGHGVIFSFDISSNTYSKVFDLQWAAWPTASLIEGVNGLLYGMTERGGNMNVGTMFSFNVSGNNYSSLHDFDYINGGYPKGSLCQASDGNLYGMASQGGTKRGGNIFKYDIQADTFGVIFNFDTSNQVGHTPYAELLELNPALAGISRPDIKPISIFPNPTEGLIQVNSATNIEEVTVSTLLGEVVYFASPDRNSFALYINKKGLHFVHLKSAEGMFYYKILIN